MGVGPATRARGWPRSTCIPSGQLAQTAQDGRSCPALVIARQGEKLTALASNCDPTGNTHASPGAVGWCSVGARQTTCGRADLPTHCVILPTGLRARLRAQSRPGRTVIGARVRFGDLHSVTRAVTLEAPISRRPRSLLRSPSSSCARCSARITLMRGRSHCSLFPCRISKRTLGCAAGSFRLGFTMSVADLAPGRAWRDGWPNRAVDSIRDRFPDGMRSNMGPPRWSSPDPFRTSFANWPKRIFDQCAYRNRTAHFQIWRIISSAPVVAVTGI